MKIAIASEGKNMDSKVSEKGGRAPYYLIFEDKKLIKEIKNPFASGAGGAGWSIAYMLADEGVKIVMAGKVGANMQAALEKKNIKFKEVSGITIKESIEKR